MSALNLAYQNLYDYHALARIRVRMELGGCRNEIIVEDAVSHWKSDAQAFMRLLKPYRNTDDLEQKTAIELIRADAIHICDSARLVNRAADGTIIFMPKNRRMAYNCSVLNHYESMVANIEWLRSMLPHEEAP